MFLLIISMETSISIFRNIHDNNMIIQLWCGKQQISTASKISCTKFGHNAQCQEVHVQH